jgi:hypothetical protein
VKGFFRLLAATVLTVPLASCGLVPTLGAAQCMRGASITPGMTEQQVVALMGKPYGMAFSRGEFRYMWMNNEGGRDVRVQFSLAADGKVEDGIVKTVTGHCDGKSF